MGIVVDIGLQRYDYNLTQHEIALATLVREGYTTLVRDFVDEDILQVQRVGEQVRIEWVATEKKQLILDEFAAIGSRSVDFGFWHLDKLGAQLIQTLAFVRDAPNSASSVVFPGNLNVYFMDVDTSLRCNWQGLRDPNARIAAKLHRFAKKHRMIVHSE